VRVQFRTDDGAVVLLCYTGLVLAADPFNRAAESGGSTVFEEQIMRMSITFETGAERYARLYRSLFIAEGLLNKVFIEYTFTV